MAMKLPFGGITEMGMNYAVGIRSVTPSIGSGDCTATAPNYATLEKLVFVTKVRRRIERDSGLEA